MAVNASKIVKLKQTGAISTTTSKMFLRDFIHDRLYAEPGGYFTKQ